MVRKKLIQGAIHVLYGHDIATGYSIHVWDTRLESDLKGGDDVLELNELRRDMKRMGTAITWTPIPG